MDSLEKRMPAKSDYSMRHNRLAEAVEMPGRGIAVLSYSAAAGSGQEDSTSARTTL